MLGTAGKDGFPRSPGRWDSSALRVQSDVALGSMRIFWVSILFFPIAGFAACAWALLDILPRPAVQFRVAGISKRNRVWLFALMGFGIGMIAAVFGLGGTNHFLGLGLFFSGEILGIMGLLAAAWYLLPVRRWLGAQLRFAKPSSPESWT